MFHHKQSNTPENMRTPFLPRLKAFQVICFAIFESNVPQDLIFFSFQMKPLRQIWKTAHTKAPELYGLEIRTRLEIKRAKVNMWMICLELEFDNTSISWLQNHMQRLWRRSLVQVWRWDGKKSLYKRRRTCSRCGKKINWQAPVEAHYRQAQWCDGETNLFSIQDGWNSILQICSKKKSKWRGQNSQPWPCNKNELLQRV